MGVDGWIMGGVRSKHIACTLRLASNVRVGAFTAICHRFFRYQSQYFNDNYIGVNDLKPSTSHLISFFTRNLESKSRISSRNIKPLI